MLFDFSSVQNLFLLGLFLSLSEKNDLPNRSILLCRSLFQQNGLVNVAFN